ncbi:uncharacterized protein TNCV_4310851 [Trichonephila clavipes]|nr:uncharacterized protein TNCV_4310851 [Trichonephila clavipes]
MRWNMLLGRAKSELPSCTKSPPPNGCLFCFVKTIGIKKKTWLDNFKRAVMEAKHANEFRPNDVMWEKTLKGLLRNPDRLLKNTDKRMVYIYNNIFFAKKDFTFGWRTVKSGEIHLIQTTHVPMLIYELPAFSLKCRSQPNVIRRSFEPHDQMLYHRTILEPHTAYLIPVGTNYFVLTILKTAFGLDIIPESLLPHLIQKGFHVGDFRKMKKFDQTPYKLPPPIPIHVPAEKRPKCPRACADSRCPRACADSRCPRACADSRCPIACADSRCPRTCADSTFPTITCADSSVPCPRATCADSTCPRTTCADSSVTSPTTTYADSPRTYADSTCIRTCADSSVPSPTVTCANSSVTSPTVTCADSSVKSPTTTYAASPRAQHFGPFGVDRCIRPAHVVRIWTPRTPAASHGTLYF